MTSNSRNYCMKLLQRVTKEEGEGRKEEAARKQGQPQ